MFQNHGPHRVAGAAAAADDTAEPEGPALPPEFDDHGSASVAGSGRDTAAVAPAIDPDSFEAWTAHEAEDGTVYYFNSVTGESTWDVPAALLVVPDSDSDEQSPPSQPEAAPSPAGSADAKPADAPDSTAAAAAAAAAPESSEADGIDRAVHEFRALLREKGVPPFASWQQWLPRLALDPRFRAVPTLAERRQLFEHFARNRKVELERERVRLGAVAKTKFRSAVLPDASRQLSVRFGKWGGQQF